MPIIDICECCKHNETDLCAQCCYDMSTTSRSARFSKMEPADDAPVPINGPWYPRNWKKRQEQKRDAS